MSVTPNPCGDPSPPGGNPRLSDCALTGNTAIDALIKANASLRSLMTMLANRHESPTIVPGTNPAGSAAVTDPSTGIITWDQAQVAAAVSKGQLEWQILFHEGEHIFFDTPVDGSAPFPYPTTGIATVDVGGYTFSYDLSNVDQYSAYEHLFVHDGLVEDTGPNGSDSTYATYEGLSGAGSVVSDAPNPPPNEPPVHLTNDQLLAIQTASAGQPIAGSVQPTESLATALSVDGFSCPQTIAITRRSAIRGININPRFWSATTGVVVQNR